jgi:ATP-dependent Lhr-like helicase
MTVLDGFHPITRAWFERRFKAPTDAQADGWPHILAGRDTLVSAPTGSGKTLAAFLVAIDRLIRKAEAGELEDCVEVVYVSPLKALSNDIQRNLDEPLEQIAEVARDLGYDLPPIRTALRTGDTTQQERQAIIRKPPHILITTPESLYLMITAERAREILRHVQTVIVDEVHALIRDKRGSHLALTLARLDHICRSRPARIGLSATVRPIEYAAQFLVGSERVSPDGVADCVVVDSGHQRDLELFVDIPPTELEAVASGEQWADVYNRLAELVSQHRTTLIFVNTRRLAERVAFRLAERIGEENVGAHHGSLSKERRHRLETRLKAGDMRALVATASLELGIDIGAVDLVCQLESPRSITTFLQRVGRSGHALGLTPKGVLFPMTRDELVECAALVRAVRKGRLDRVYPPEAPLDILSQQIVAEAAAEDWREDDMFDLVRSAWPYRDLRRADFNEVVEMLGEGIAVGTGRAAHYLHRDRINGVLRGRRGARMTAIQCGGAIPEIADYRVIAEPEGAFVGTLDEDFSIESMAGDIVLLGTTSWRIKRIESAGIVRVENAHGAPPTIPFWNGEAPGRTLELSEEVSDLRIELADRIRDATSAHPAASSSGGSGFSLTSGDGQEGKTDLPSPAAAGEVLGVTARDLAGVIAWAERECALPRYGAEQIVQYVRVQQEMMGLVPSQRDVVFERFFDESGGMQLVVHAPFGARINRAWGLALRKRFCVSFDFELQAAATDDAMLLSIGPNNSFPLETMFQLVKKPWLRESVEQALLVANSPVWQSRWRWNTTRALAVLRQRNGKRVPPPLQRMRADDLMAAVFPVLVACQENLSGPIELPDHPLTRQSMHDCLTEAMDIQGLGEIMDRIERGEIQFHARDTTEPSPFAHEMINSPVYSFLDDAPLEERRARSVVLRRSLPKSGRDLGILDPDAIELVVSEAQPQPCDAEEVHDTLLSLVAVRPAYAPEWQAWFDALVDQRRAATIDTSDGDRLWFAAENLSLVERLYPGSTVRPEVRLSPELRREVDEDAARLAIIRGYMEILGPTTVSELADRTALGPAVISSALARLENEGGVVIRGHFRVGAEDEEWCDRRLLARVHRYTLDRLRSEIEPVSASDLMRFLLRWQHLAPGTQLEGKRGLLEAVTQLQGYDIPAVAWERHILPARVAAYKGLWLDELCIAGDVAWARLAGRKGNTGRAASASSATPVSLARRGDLPWLVAGVRWNATRPTSSAHPEAPEGSAAAPSRGAAAEIFDLLSAKGALFYDDIVAATRRLPGDVERGIWDLVARGLATADGFQALRSLMASTKKRSFRRPQRARLFRTLAVSGVPSGRWSLLPTSAAHPEAPEEFVPDDAQLLTEELAEAWAEQLLFRYGVVFRDLIRSENVTVPWREILRCLRRMEAQGTVRGGRFVAGFYGEQYARPEAVEALRAVRKSPRTGELVRVSAVDPLNLTGVITPAPRVASIHTKAVVHRDGVPLGDAPEDAEPLAAAG